MIFIASKSSALVLAIELPRRSFGPGLNLAEAIKLIECFHILLYKLNW